MENFGIDDFLEMMAAEKGAAQNTLAAYRRDVEQFAAFAKVSDVLAFRQSHISAFVQKLSKDKLAPKTIARNFGIARIFQVPLFRKGNQRQSGRQYFVTEAEKAVAEISD